MATDPQKKTRIKSITASAVVLTAFAALAALLLAGTWSVTHERIADNERHARLAVLNELVPAMAYDNDLFTDTHSITAPEALGSTEPVIVYRAYQNGKPVAALFDIVAPDGYSGSIKMLLGVWADGRVAGVRVLAHKETPGLGDKIELARADWILSFNGKSVGEPPLESWAVKADGGVFDQFTGATITPRAVVEAVQRALVYFDAHREQFFAQPATGPDNNE